MTAWARVTAASEPHWRSFVAALARPQQAQGEMLRRILLGGERSSFGARHEFAKIRTVDEFRSAVPIRSYEDFRPYIERIAAGESHVLTDDEVIAFEQTGGSTSGAKLVPYTARTIEAFTAAVLSWAHDLLTVRPAMGRGRAYLAISPATRAIRITPSGLPIGVASDAIYFGRDLEDAVTAFSAVPGSAALGGDPHEWAVFTLVHLVAAEDLSFISVWSPSFFSQLLLALTTHGDRVCVALDHGSLGIASPPRAELLRRLLAESPLDTTALWPHLDTISAWTDAASAPFAAALRGQLPHAYLQGKGLLATEGVVTIPLCFAAHPVPALTSGFLEFIEEDGTSRLAHELEEGRAYRVVMTTWGGLYRYDIGDKVRCCGFLAADGLGRGTIPMLAFLGRGDASSDLVGEKLTDDFATSCLAGRRGFAVLFPVIGPPTRYGLLVEADSADDDVGFCRQVERALCRNPQYAHARRMGQLAPLTILPVAAADARYTEWALGQGRRLSDIKPPALITNPVLPGVIWPDEWRTKLFAYRGC